MYTHLFQMKNNTVKKWFVDISAGRSSSGMDKKPKTWKQVQINAMQLYCFYTERNTVKLYIL